MSHVSNVQARTSATVETLKKHSVDLLEYAQTMARVEGGITDAHQLAAKEMVDTIAAATSEYVTAQRELLETFVTNPTGATRAAVLRAIAKADSIHTFVKKEFTTSVSREAFFARLSEYREQASAVQSQLLNYLGGSRHGNPADLVTKATELYSKFEDAADPYTMHLLKKIRLQLMAATRRQGLEDYYVVVTRGSGSSESEVAAVEKTVDDPAPTVEPAAWNPTDAQVPHQRGGHDECFDHHAGGGLLEDYGQDDELFDEADQGLVLRVGSDRALSSCPGTPGTEIDLEDELPPDAGFA